MRMSALEKRFVNSPSHTQRVAEQAYELLSHINCKSGWRYLDVGCGVGTAARKVAATSDLSVTGIDVDPKQIQAARSGAARPNLQYKVMDATKLEFADGAFDVVASRMATHHIPHWERALSEMVRVLRPGATWFTAILFFRHGWRRLPVLFVSCVFRQRRVSISWRREVGWPRSTSLAGPAKWT